MSAPSLELIFVGKNIPNIDIQLFSLSDFLAVLDVECRLSWVDLARLRMESELFDVDLNLSGNFWGLIAD